MILRSFCFSIAVIVFGCLLLPVPQELFVFGISYFPAFAYTLLCGITFVIGYFLLYSRVAITANLESPDENRYITTRVLLLLLAIAVSGVAILIWQINSTVGVIGYLGMVSGTSGVSGNFLRDSTVFVSYSDGGGLPGWVKIFNWNSVIAPFCFLALMYQGYRLRGMLNCFLAAAIFVVYFMGTALRLDRLSILAVMPVLLSYLAGRGNRKLRVAIFACITLLLSVMIGQSIRRASGTSFLDILALYLQLGTVNLAVLMRSNFIHTLGFGGIFSQIAWFLRSLGVTVISGSQPEIPWPRDSAMNGLGYWFMDFGWYGCIVFSFVGMLAWHIDKRASLRHLNTHFWKVVQWVTAYGVLSIPVVPSYSAPEFWLMLCLSPVLVKHLTASINKRSLRTECVVEGIKTGARGILAEGQ